MGNGRGVETMRPTSNRTGPRAGFTLVELLVVMTIIAILFALTAAAVVKSMPKMDETRTRNDISQLANAVQAFKTEFAVAYIPDKLVLPPSADPASLQYISALWPRLPLTASAGMPSLSNAAYWGVPSGTPKLTL